MVSHLVSKWRPLKIGLCTWLNYMNGGEGPPCWMLFTSSSPLMLVANGIKVDMYNSIISIQTLFMETYYSKKLVRHVHIKC